MKFAIVSLYTFSLRRLNYVNVFSHAQWEDDSSQYLFEIWCLNLNIYYNHGVYYNPIVCYEERTKFVGGYRYLYQNISQVFTNKRVN